MLGLFQVASGLADCGGKRTPEPYLREDVLIPMWSADLQKCELRRETNTCGCARLDLAEMQQQHQKRRENMKPSEGKHETLIGKT